jgi:hypothetical protein
MNFFLTNQQVGGRIISTIPPTPLNNAHQGGFSFLGSNGIHRIMAGEL